MRLSKSCMVYSTICGLMKTLSRWTMFWTLHCLYAAWFIILLFLIRLSTDCTFCYWSCRYVIHYFHYRLLNKHCPISRIWEKCFMERRWHSYSSWPYDVLQRCSARHYRWFPFEAGASWLDAKPDTPTAESQEWVWRVTCASLGIFAYVFLR